MNSVFSRIGKLSHFGFRVRGGPLCSTCVGKHPPLSARRPTPRLALSARSEFMSPGEAEAGGETLPFRDERPDFWELWVGFPDCLFSPPVPGGCGSMGQRRGGCNLING